MGRSVSDTEAEPERADAPIAPPESGGGLREKLEWLMLFRLVLVTFLLGSAVLVNVNDVASFSDPSYLAIVSLIVGTYVATLLYVFWFRSGWSVRQLAFLQLIGDVVLAAGLVLLTHGIHSIFTFLFFLTIFNGAVLMGRTGAMFSASGSSLGLAGIVVLQFGDFAFLWSVLPETLAQTDRVPVYALIIHLVGFFTVAALSGYLAEKLGQVGTELERRQIDLKELRALNENIVRSLASGLVTLDLSGRVIFFNETAEEITGRKSYEVNLRPLATSIPSLAPIVEAAEALIAGPSRPRVEVRFERPDGRVMYLGVSLTALRDAEGRRTGYIMIMQDVSSVKSLEEKLLRQEHLSAIGKLSAAIAHEIRNPLAAISGSIEMLKMLLDPPEEEQRLMGIVIREVERLNALIEDFLEYARPESYTKSTVDIVEILDESLELMKRDTAIAANVTFVLDDGLSQPVQVEADAGRIRQVYWNLIRNACEALGGGGEVTLRRRLVQHPRTGSPLVEVRVEDDGSGLAEDVMPNLFEPFFTTKEEGTGLGLATSHRIVTAHGGTLEAENLDGGGACFVFRLPCMVDDAFEAEADWAMEGEALLPEGMFTERMDTLDLEQVGPRAGRLVPT